MNIPDARSLSAEAQQALRERVIHAIEAEGLGVAEAARAFGVHRCTAGTWYGAYRRGGARALAARPRGRRPRPLLSADPEARLWAVLTGQTPAQAGLAGELWTRDAVAAWAARALGVRRSRWVWGRWLKDHGLTPQKPARRAYQQDPAAVRRWLRDEYPRVEAEAKAEGAEVHWLDGAGLRSDCPAGRGYAPRGQTPVAPVPGKRFGVNYLATLTNLGVLRFMVFCGRLTAAVFLVFLARLIAGRPGKVYLILDRHPAHRAKRVPAWAAARPEKIRLIYLPPYSPERNPVEYLNNDVKANAQREGRARDQAGLAGKVRAYLRATQRMAWLVKRYFRAKHVNYAA